MTAHRLLSCRWAHVSFKFKRTCIDKTKQKFTADLKPLALILSQISCTVGGTMMKAMTKLVFTNWTVTFKLRTRNSIRGFVHPSVRPSVRPWARVEKWKNERFRSFLCVCVGRGHWRMCVRKSREEAYSCVSLYLCCWFTHFFTRMDSCYVELIEKKHFGVPKRFVS